MYTSITELPSQVTSSLDDRDATTWMETYNRFIGDDPSEKDVAKVRRKAWESVRTAPSSFSFCIKASVEVVDKDHEIIDVQSIKDHMDSFISYGGNLINEHGNYVVGCIWGWDPIKVSGADGVEVWGNIFGGDQVYDEARRAFVGGRNNISVAGEATEGTYQCDSRGCYTRRNVKQLLEMSLCDVPANRQATMVWYNRSAKLTKSESTESSAFAKLSSDELQQAAQAMSKPNPLRRGYIRVGKFWVPRWQRPDNWYKMNMEEKQKALDEYYLRRDDALTGARQELHSNPELMLEDLRHTLEFYNYKELADRITQGVENYKDWEAKYRDAHKDEPDLLGRFRDGYLIDKESESALPTATAEYRRDNPDNELRLGPQDIISLGDTLAGKFKPVYNSKFGLKNAPLRSADLEVLKQIARRSKEPTEYLNLLRKLTRSSRDRTTVKDNVEDFLDAIERFSYSAGESVGALAGKTREERQKIEEDLKDLKEYRTDKNTSQNSAKAKEMRSKRMLNAIETLKRDPYFRPADYRDVMSQVGSLPWGWATDPVKFRSLRFISPDEKNRFDQNKVQLWWDTISDVLPQSELNSLVPLSARDKFPSLHEYVNQLMYNIRLAPDTNNSSSRSALDKVAERVDDLMNNRMDLSKMWDANPAEVMDLLYDLGLEDELPTLLDKVGLATDSEGNQVNEHSAPRPYEGMSAKEKEAYKKAMFAISSAIYNTAGKLQEERQNVLEYLDDLPVTNENVFESSPVDASKLSSIFPSLRDLGDPDKFLGSIGEKADRYVNKEARRVDAERRAEQYAESGDAKILEGLTPDDFGFDTAAIKNGRTRYNRPTKDQYDALPKPIQAQVDKVLKDKGWSIRDLPTRLQTIAHRFSKRVYRGDGSGANRYGPPSRMMPARRGVMSLKPRNLRIRSLAGMPICGIPYIHIRNLWDPWWIRTGTRPRSGPLSRAHFRRIPP